MIILISGKQGSGKTTLANNLRRNLTSFSFDSARSFKFATPIYELHDFILNKMEGFTGVPRVKKDGDLLQAIGLWGRKKYGENVWCDIVVNETGKYLSGFGGRPKRRLAIIDDCRFVNEFEAFPDALRIRMMAPEEIRKNRTDSWRENTNHESEVALDAHALDAKFDLYLESDVLSDQQCLRLTMEAMQKNNWQETRPQEIVAPV